MSRLTLKDVVSFEGIGLHSGKLVTLKLLPGAVGAGFVFQWGAERFSITEASHTGDGRGTSLTFGPHSVMTVEHLLAALRGLAIDDVLICPEGGEIPLLDGSSRGFCEAISAVGVVEQGGMPEPLRIAAPLYVTSPDERKICAVLPSDVLRFTYALEYGDNAIGSEVVTVEPKLENFVDELGQCRTFCLFEEVEQMRQLGLGLGGTVETALIVKGHEILTPGGLRRHDEFVRHKILDFIGDLTLLGRPVLGHFIGVRAGHAMHQKLVERIQREYC